MERDAFSDLAPEVGDSDSAALSGDDARNFMIRQAGGG